MNGTFKGYCFAVISAITYGMNPLFGLHLYRDGLTPFSVLFYRFLFAALFLGVYLLWETPRRFRVNKRYFLALLTAGVLLGYTCLLWFISFRNMDSGIAASILFTYPVMVALIMFFGFHEKMNAGTCIGTVLALGGVILLSLTGTAGRVTPLGIGCILLSALTYAVYIVLVQQSKLKYLHPETLTFYAFLTGVLVIFFHLRCGLDLQRIPSLAALGNVLGVAFFPSVLSFFLMAVAIRFIGATKTAVIGAFEPLTAVLIGIFVFGERLTLRSGIGILLILVAVTAVICSRTGEKKTRVNRKSKRTPENF